MSVTKTIGVVGAVAVVGALTVGPALQSDPPTEQPAPVLYVEPADVVDGSLPATKSITLETQPVDRSTWRLAVADWPCLQTEGITADTLRRVCLWGKLISGHIVCLTDRAAVHKCEVEPPAHMLKKFGVCRYRDAEARWRTFAGWVPLAWTPPAEWTNASCQVIVAEAFWHRSMGGVDGPLTLALRAACGWESITPKSHGLCPDCLVWPEGCPPCRLLADKYERAWAGHEAECMEE